MSDLLRERASYREAKHPIKMALSGLSYISIHVAVFFLQPAKVQEGTVPVA